MAPPPRRTVQLEACVLSARGLVSSKDAEGAVSSSASVSLLGNAAVESELVSETPEPTFSLSTLHTFKAEDGNCALLLSTPLSVSVFEGAEKTLLGSATLSLEPLMQTAGISEQWLPLLTAEGEPAAGEVLVCVNAAMALMTEEEWESSTMVTLSVNSLHQLPPKWAMDELAAEADHGFNYTATCTFLGEELPPYAGKAAPPPPPPPEEEPAPPAEEGAAEGAAEGEEGAEAPAPAPAEAPAAAPDPQAEAEAAGAAISFEGPSVTRFLGPEATRALRAALKAGEAALSFSLARETKTPESVFDSNGPKYAALCAAVPVGLIAVDATSAVERAVIKPAPLPEEPPVCPEGKGAPVATEVEEEEEGAPHPYEAAGTYLKMTLSVTRPLEPKPEPPPPPLPKVSELIPKRVLPQFAAKSAVEEFDAQVASIVESMVGEWSTLFPELDLHGAAADDASKDDRRRALLYALNTSGKYWMFKERLKRSVVRLTKDTMSRPTAEPLDARSMELFYNDLYVKLTQRLHQALNGIFFPPTEAPLAPSMPEQAEGASAHGVLGVLAAESEAIFDFANAATYHKERIASSKHSATAWYDYALFLMRTNDAPMAEECSREAIALTPQSAECLLAHGTILASRGSFEQAEVMLKSSLELTPDSTDAWLVVSLLYGLMGRTHDQKASAKQARQLHGADTLAGAYLALANKLLPLNAAVLIESALQQEEELAGGASGALLLCRGEMLLYKAGGQPSAPARKGPVDRHTRLKEIFHSIDSDGDGSVDLAEYRAATDNATMLKLFAYMDAQGDRDGTLSMDEWLSTMSKVGKSMSDEQFEQDLGSMVKRKPGLAEAVSTLEAGVELARMSASGFTLLGQARLRLGEAAAAREAFEKALDLSPQPYPLPALLLLGQLCLDAGDNARAKELFLYACRQAPSCTSWRGAGVACLRLDELGQAEEALAEANVLNNRHPVVWGQLALLSLKKDRFDEAAQALGQAYKLNLADAELLTALSVALFAVGKWADAESAARKAMLGGSSGKAHKALGDALMEQQRYEEALAEYKGGLYSPDSSSDDARHCKAHASRILHFHLNRPAEADQL